MTKRKVILVTMRIEWVLDIKKVEYELSVPYEKVGALQADNDTSNPPENVHKNVSLVRSFDWNILYSFCKLFN